MRPRSLFGQLLQSRIGGIRRRLLRDLVLFVLAITGLILVVTLVLGARLKKELAWDEIGRATTQVSEEISKLASPVEMALEVLRTRGRAGGLDLTELKALNTLLIPTMVSLPQVSSQQIANGHGDEYLLMRDGDTWLTRSVSISGQGTHMTWRRWDAAGVELGSWTEDSDYDPRARPWFIGAVDHAPAGGVYWTRPYVFYALKAPGVTASVSWQSPDDEELVFVAGMDVLLSEVVGFLQELELGKGGRAFLFDGDGAVYVVPPEAAHTGTPVAKGAFFSADRSAGGSVVFDAMERWKRRRQDSGEPVRFYSQQESWWARFVPVYKDSRSLWIGVILPERDLMGAIRHNRGMFVLGGIGVLLLGIGMVVFFVSRYGQQLKDLPGTKVDRRDPERSIRTLIESGEGPTVEFKSTIRMNLRTGRTGKEMELAWLKAVVAFLNTDGGILLLGVNDDGEITGIEVDGFDNQDKCRLHFRNLVRQHIGLEFSKYLNFDIFGIAGRQVAMVECERAGEPAFLFGKSGEAFYIRSGPSSVELSVSKALKYLQQHF